MNRIESPRNISSDRFLLPFATTRTHLRSFETIHTNDNRNQFAAPVTLISIKVDLGTRRSVNKARRARRLIGKSKHKLGESVQYTSTSCVFPRDSRCGGDARGREILQASVLEACAWKETFWNCLREFIETLSTFPFLMNTLRTKYSDTALCVLEIQRRDECFVLIITNHFNVS